MLFVNTNFEVQKTMNFIFDSEIKFHVWCWDMKIKRKNANPANINIYADGSVVDPRPWLNTLVDIMFGGEYE